MSETEQDVEQDADHQKFENIISDFIKDILNTFPELQETLNDNLKIIISDSEDKKNALDKVKEYCKNTYPEKFFDILYQNESLFDNKTPLYFLPGIDFQELWRENITENTRKTMWNYLQLILFTVISDMSDSTSFGDTAKLFEDY